MIKNITDFYNLINNCGLSSAPTFLNFMKSVDEYRVICSCINARLKTEKLEHARRIYISLVTSGATHYFPLFKKKLNVSKILFYDKDRLIASV